MTKKKYCPMTIEHEALEMNQAIAGACAWLKADGDANCDKCLGQGFPHTYSVYGQMNDQGEWINGAIGISNQDVTSFMNEYNNSSCYKGMEGGMPVRKGDAFFQNSDALQGHFDPAINGTGNGVYMPNYIGNLYTGFLSSDSIIYNQNS